MSDLGLGTKFPEIRQALPGFFSTADIERLTLPGMEFEPLAERLFTLDRNADTYFACLANLHKRRLKYQRILRSQPIPTIDQVGPRGLLQFGSLTPRALGALLFWRKWLYDIDNRAAQETGYLFEPIIAYAIGGAPISAKQSPIKREGDGKRGRQIDCIRDRRAYEFKMRVTIAASGQGRWGEELQFPRECRLSGFVPVIVVLDPTPNPKLAELTKVFLAEGGEVYTGAKAWEHLDWLAGPTMAHFLETYVRGPIEALLAEASDALPELSLAMKDGTIIVSVGGERLVIQRQLDGLAEDGDEMPEDAGDVLPGPRLATGGTSSVSVRAVRRTCRPIQAPRRAMQRPSSSCRDSGGRPRKGPIDRASGIMREDAGHRWWGRGCHRPQDGGVCHERAPHMKQALPPVETSGAVLCK